MSKDTQPSKHTPGPWKRSIRGGMITTSDEPLICENICQILGDYNNDSQTIANADLIASAPSLLEENQKLKDSLVRKEAVAKESDRLSKEIADGLRKDNQRLREALEKIDVCTESASPDREATLLLIKYLATAALKPQE